MTVHGHNRSGITLMEVLISIGILAVGLSAVVALIPAGGSEAQRAMREDRKANVGLAALEDAITRGILSPPATPPFIVDPTEPAGSPGLPGLPAASFGGLGTGSFASDEVFRSQDDPSYTLESSGEDEPPEPLYYSGNVKRLSDGNYSWLATLVPAGNNQNYLLSVVTFSKRAVSPPPNPLTSVSGSTVQFAWAGSLGSLQDAFPRGSVVLLSDGSNIWEWRRVIFVTLAGGNAELMLASDAGVSAGDDLFVFPGAVGIAERVVRLEEASPWSQ